MKRCRGNSNRLRRGVKSEQRQTATKWPNDSNRLRRGVKSEPDRLSAYRKLNSNRLRRGVKSEHGIHPVDES